MITSNTVTEEKKDRARKLLTLPKDELYTYYINTIASDRVKRKNACGQKCCFNYWRSYLQRLINAPIGEDVRY